VHLLTLAGFDAHSYTEAEIAIVENKTKVTEIQLRAFLHVCWVKYVKARIEPGKDTFTDNHIGAYIDTFQALLSGLLVLSPLVNQELR